MTAPVFVDTNVLVYRRDASNEDGGHAAGHQVALQSEMVPRVDGSPV